MVNVFVTVDTEHSIGGAFKNPRLQPIGNERIIYGKIGNAYYGLPLIIDIADQYGIKLTFFVEVLNKHFFGEGETREVCQYILESQHDLQLHIHPNYVNFKKGITRRPHLSDRMADYPYRMQEAYIAEGKELLIKYGTQEPIAFRAGNYSANINTLKALERNGFIIDSSANQNCSSFLGTTINAPYRINGIFEVPITNFLQTLPFQAPKYKPLDLNGVSFEEIRYVLQRAQSSSLHAMTIILHCFSFIKAYDPQYTKVRKRQNVIDRYTRLCEFLKNNADQFHCRTFGTLQSSELDAIGTISRHHFPKVPSLLSLRRIVSQVQDRLV